MLGTAFPVRCSPSAGLLSGSPESDSSVAQRGKLNFHRANRPSTPDFGSSKNPVMVSRRRRSIDRKAAAARQRKYYACNRAKRLANSHSRRTAARPGRSGINWLPDARSGPSASPIATSAGTFWKRTLVRGGAGCNNLGTALPTPPCARSHMLA